MDLVRQVHYGGVECRHALRSNAAGASPHLLPLPPKQTSGVWRHSGVAFDRVVVYGAKNPQTQIGRGVTLGLSQLVKTPLDHVTADGGERELQPVVEVPVNAIAVVALGLLRQRVPVEVERKHARKRVIAAAEASGLRIVAVAHPEYFVSRQLAGLFQGELLLRVPMVTLRVLPLGRSR